MAQYDINLREYWRIIKRRKFIVLTFAVVLGLFSVFYDILTAPQPLYTTACIIEFQQAQVIEGIYSSDSNYDADDIDTQITVIKSYAIFQLVAEKLGLVSPDAIGDDGQLSEEVIPIIESLQSKTEVIREGWTSILHISVTDTDPEFAKDLANSVALTYKDVHTEEQMERTKETLQYITEQLVEVRERLREAEDKFNRFSQDNELISIDLQSETLLATIQQIQERIRKAQQDKTELQGLRLRLEKFIEDPSGADQDFFSTTPTNQYQSSYNSLVELLLKRDTLLKDFTLMHPEVVVLSSQISETVKKMVILLNSQVSSVEKETIELGKELERVDRKIKVLMAKKLDFDRLKRTVDSNNDLTVLLERKEQEALIRRAEKPEEVKIIKPALLPVQPTNLPNVTATGVAGAIIGLVLGMVIGFIVETFDTSLGAIEDVEETLGTKVLGIIPQTDVREIRGSLKEKDLEGVKAATEDQSIYLVSHFVPQSMMAESFRALRTSVQFKDAEKKTQSIAVASTSPKEGKTVVAINLALTMAQAGMKVLLVGSDLRKPTLDRVFGVGPAPGLADVLMGNLPWRDTVKTVMDMVMGKLTQTQVITTPGLDNVHLITSGPKPPNPAELIESNALDDFLEEAKQEYDMVIFDSPPILSTADAAILAAKVDGVLLVYRIGTVSRGLLKRATAQLEQVKCNIMGVILNGMRPEVSSDFEDFASYNYYYAYGSEDKEEKSVSPKKWMPALKKKENTGRMGAKKTFLGDKRIAPHVEAHKKVPKGLWGLVALAIVSLVVGGLILSQSGIVDPLSQNEKGSAVRNNGIKAVVKKGISRTSEKKQSVPIPTSSNVKNDMGNPTGDEIGHLVTEAPMEIEAQAEIEPSVIPEMAATETFARLSVESEDSPESLAPTKPTGMKSSSYPFSLQLGAFRGLNEANAMISLCKEKGLLAYWAKVDLNDGVWYRVFVGHFEDREQAQRFKQKHDLSEAYIKNTKYANLINTYSSSREVEDRIQSLKTLGYLPYVIQDADGESRLFVGVFMTEEGAKDQHDDLEADGIENRVVER